MTERERIRVRRELEVHGVEVAHRGNFVRYRAGVGVAPACAGNRGEVVSFSAASRRRMQTFLNSVDRTEAASEQMWFGTLTYPFAWPNCPSSWKSHLKSLRKRMERVFGALGVVWKLEPQRRGAPHFHLLIFVPREWAAGMRRTGERFYNGRRQTVWAGGQLGEFRRWMSRAWFEVVDSGDEKHLLAGTSVEPLESWNGVVSYASKYLGKDATFLDQETGEALRVGRLWGVWRQDLWPVQKIRRTLGEAEWVKARRVFRRYMERRGRCLRGEDGRPPAFQWIGSPRSCSAFIPFDVAHRVLESVCWYGSDYAELWEIRRRAQKEVELSREVKFYS